MELRHPLPMAEVPGGMPHIEVQTQGQVALPPAILQKAFSRQHPLSTRSTAHLNSQASRGSLTTRAQQSFPWPLLQAGITPKEVNTLARTSDMNIRQATEALGADNQHELLAPDHDQSPIASVGSGGGRASGSAA